MVQGETRGQPQKKDEQLRAKAVVSPGLLCSHSMTNHTKSCLWLPTKHTSWGVGAPSPDHSAPDPWAVLPQDMRSPH